MQGFPRLTHVESGESVKVRDDDGMELVGWAIPESLGGGGSKVVNQATELALKLNVSLPRFALVMSLLIDTRVEIHNSKYFLQWG